MTSAASPLMTPRIDKGLLGYYKQNLTGTLMNSDLLTLWCQSYGGMEPDMYYVPCYRFSLGRTATFGAWSAPISAARTAPVAT